jgi:hypothetical protein
VLEGTTKRFLKELDEIENEFLVAVEQDLADSALPRSNLPKLVGKDAFVKHFRKEADRFEGRMNKHLRESAAQGLGSFIASEIASRVAARVALAAAARLGVSGAILSSSAATTVATFGLSVVAGIAVDYLLDVVLEALGYDPAGEVASQLNDGLDKLESSLLTPSKEHAMVISALVEAAEEDTDDGVKESCVGALREILASGTVGLPAALWAAGNDRQTALVAALEPMVVGASGPKAKKVEQWGNRATHAGQYTPAEARRTADRLLNGLTGPDVERVRAGLKRRDRGARIDAARAAVLLFGYTGPDPKPEGRTIVPPAGPRGVPSSR